MSISRLLALSLLSSACVAQVAVQSPTDKNLVPPGTEAKAPDSSPQFNLEAPGPDPKAGTSARALQFKPPVRLNGPGVAQNKTCYFIQAYHFSRDNPQSDAVRLTGVSTCTPAEQFQLREADGRLENTGR